MSIFSSEKTSAGDDATPLASQSSVLESAPFNRTDTIPGSKIVETSRAINLDAHLQRIAAFKAVSLER